MVFSVSSHVVPTRLEECSHELVKYFYQGEQKHRLLDLFILNIRLEIGEAVRDVFQGIYLLSCSLSIITRFKAFYCDHCIFFNFNTFPWFFLQMKWNFYELSTMEESKLESIQKSYEH